MRNISAKLLTQENSLSPVCIPLWALRLLEVEKNLSQSLQENSLSPLCVIARISYSLLVSHNVWHFLHENLLLPVSTMVSLILFWICIKNTLITLISKSSCFDTCFCAHTGHIEKKILHFVCFAMCLYFVSMSHSLHFVLSPSWTALLWKVVWHLLFHSYWKLSLVTASKGTISEDRVYVMTSILSPPTPHHFIENGNYFVF